MLKEAKKWVEQLETMLKDLSEEFGKPVEELDAEFENWYYDGGQQWDFDGSGPNSVEAFRREYSTRMEGDSEEDEEPETAYAESKVIIQPFEGINKPYYYIKRDTEGHTTECFGADKEGIEALRQVVHGREIEWVPGWNVTAERELNAAEFKHLVSMYAGFVR